MSTDVMALPAPPVSLPARRRRAAWALRALSRSWQPLVCIGIFCALAVLVCGGGSPVSSTVMPVNVNADALQEMWFLAWPAFALSHGLNPFYSGFIAYPHGVNLMSSTSMPLLGLIASPVTLTAGPVAAFNLMVRLAFVSSATSMLFVLRRYVSWWPAAFAGALLYGFSPFMLAEGFTHVFLTFLPFPPLVLLLMDDLLVRRPRSPKVTGALLGLVAAAQLLVSAEVLAITLLTVLAGTALLVLRRPRRARAHLRQAAAGVAACLAVFVVLGGYPIWVYLAGAQHVSGPQHPALTYFQFHDDLLGLIVPTSAQRIGFAHWFARGDLLVQGNIVDHANYFGAPLLALLGYVVVRCRREGIVAMSALLGAAALVLTLGVTLYVDGQGHFTALRLPYDALLHLPFVNGLLAPRFVLVAYLAAAVVLAVGLDRLRRDGLLPAWAWPSGPRSPDARAARPHGRTAACGALAFVALAPLLPSHEYARVGTPVPRFFRDTSALQRIPAGSVVLPYPNAQLPTVPAGVAPEARSMLWQAVARMDFRMIGAYAAQPLPGGTALGQGDQLLDPPTVVQHLFGWALYGSPALPPVTVTPAVLEALRSFCTLYDVSTIVVDPSAGVHPDAVVSYVSRSLGRPPQQVGGVDAWFDVAAQLGGLRLRDRVTAMRTPR